MIGDNLNFEPSPNIKYNPTHLRILPTLFFLTFKIYRCHLSCRQSKVNLSITKGGMLDSHSVLSLTDRFYERI